MRKYNHEMTDRQKEKLFHSTIDMYWKRALRNGVRLRYLDNDIVLSVGKSKKLKDVKIKQLPFRINAMYEFGSASAHFTINKTQSDDGKEAFRNISHETMHMLQEASVNQMDLYDSNSSEYNYLLTLKANIIPITTGHSMFGLKVAGTMYIEDLPCGNTTLDDVNYALYELMITERSARSTSNKYYSLAYNESLDNTTYEKSAQTIKDFFECNELSDKNICQLIDSAQRKLYCNLEPTNMLELRLMYHMVATLAYQRDEIDRFDYQRRMGTDAINIALTEYAHLHNSNKVSYNFNTLDITNNLDILHYVDFESIQSLSIGERINNPLIMLYAVCNYGKDAISLIPNMEILKEWCYLNAKEVDPNLLDAASQYLGPEFSSEVCLAQNKDYEEPVAIQDIENILISNQEDYIEEYNFGDERAR